MLPSLKISTCKEKTLSSLAAGILRIAPVLLVLI
jgi:hypothetical protein